MPSGQAKAGFGEAGLPSRDASMFSRARAVSAELGLLAGDR